MGRFGLEARKETVVHIEGGPDRAGCKVIRDGSGEGGHIRAGGGVAKRQGAVEVHGGTDSMSILPAIIDRDREVAVRGRDVDATKDDRNTGVAAAKVQDTQAHSAEGGEANFRQGARADVAVDRAQAGRHITNEADLAAFFRLGVQRGLDGGGARAALLPVGDIHEGAAGKVVGDGAAVGRVDKGARILGRSWVPARRSAPDPNWMASISFDVGGRLKQAI